MGAPRIPGTKRRAGAGAVARRQLTDDVVWEVHVPSQGSMASGRGTYLGRYPSKAEGERALEAWHREQRKGAA